MHAKSTLAKAVVMIFLLNMIPVNMGIMQQDCVKAATVTSFPYTNSFETYLPPDWIRDGLDMMLSSNTAYRDGTYSLKLFKTGNTATETNPASIYLPINASGKSDLTISFYTKRPSNLAAQPNNSTTFQVSYDNGANYETLYTFSDAESDNFTTERVMPLDLSTKTETQKSQMRVRFRSATNNNNAYWVDLMTITATGDDMTPPPDVTGLSVTGRTKTSISLAWTAGSGEAANAYDIYVDGAVNPVASVSATSATITGLYAGTAYSLTVKARDAANNRSGGVSISEATWGVSIPYFDGFDDTATTLPTNWGYTTGTGVGILKCSTGSKRSGNYGLKLAVNSPATSANAYLGIDATGKSNLAVSFYCRASSLLATDASKLEVSYNGGTDWTPLHTFSEKLAASTYERLIFPLGPDANDNPHVRIRFTTTNTSDTNFYGVDDLSITEDSFHGNIQEPIMSETGNALTGLKILRYAGASDIDVVVAKYDSATKSLKAIEIVKDVTLAAGTPTQITLSTPVGVAAGETVKAFVWDDTDNMRPMTDSSDILGVQ